MHTLKSRFPTSGAFPGALSLGAFLLGASLLAALSTFFVSSAQAQVIGTASVRTDNPTTAYTSARVGAANEAGIVAGCKDSLEVYCTNNFVATATPIRRKVVLSARDLRANLAVAKTDGAAVAVPGGSTTYTITVENRAERLGRLFYIQGVTIAEIDPLTGAVLNSFPSPVADTPEGGYGLATTPTSVLIGGSAAQDIYELDPDTGAVLRTIPNPTVPISGLAYRDDEIFVLTDEPFPDSTQIIVLAYETGDVRRTLGGSDTPTARKGLTAAPDSLFSAGAQDLYQFEPNDLLGDFQPWGQNGPLTSVRGIAALGDELFIADTDIIRVVDLETSLALRSFPLQVDGLGADEFVIYEDVYDAVVTDIFPPELTCTWTCAPSAGAACNAGPVAGDLIDTVDLPLGASLTYTVDCAIAASASGTLTNTATVSMSANIREVDPADNTATDVNTLTAQADLSITKTDDVDPIAAGGTLTYTIEVANAGPSDAASVVVADSLPKEVSAVSTTGCDNDPNGAANCSLGTIPAGGSASFTVEVVVDPDAPSGTIQNTASVTAASLDPVTGNNGASEETTVDGLIPTVNLVGSTLDTGDGELSECEEARVDITQLHVVFGKPMQDPPGDTDEADVTNPANYLLAAAGDDGDFSTDVCGPALGDDELIFLSVAGYDAGLQTATLALNKGLPTEDSLYRLLVCDSIRDLVGNRLDGDGDGAAGGDFLRTYRVERDNLLINGQLDCSLDPWVAVSDVPGEVAYDADDFQDSSVSGSARLMPLGEGPRFTLGQCIDIEGPAMYDFSGAVRVDLGPEAALFLGRTCEFFAEPACIGDPLSTAFESESLTDTGGLWIPRISEVLSPPATQSALCSFGLFTPDGASFDAAYDDLRLTQTFLFRDGFESGDTSAWSSTIP